MNMLQTVSLFLARSKQSVRTLPSLFHLFLFLSAVLIAILSLNFEVFRVIRLGDLLILLFALLISIHWYGQKMLETGYKEGMSRTSKTDSSETGLL